MTNYKIHNLQTTANISSVDFMPIYSDTSTSKISVASMAEKLWEQMYVNAKKVIVVCSHCGSGNAMTNPVCCKCEAPLGEDAKK